MWKKFLANRKSVKDIEIEKLRKREEHYLTMIEAQSEIIKAMQENPDYYTQTIPTQLKRVK